MEDSPSLPSRPSTGRAPHPRFRARLVCGAALLAVVAGSLAACGGPPPAVHAHSKGPLSAPGGPFLYDRDGRVVMLHGVNAIYKYPPFELYPSAGSPWNLSAPDASEMANLGFNVVRLGVTWEGLEPGTAGPNDPAICSSGSPQDPHQYSQQAVEGYLRRLAETVDLLGRYHIYSIIDMHQDVYSQAFGGEGAPGWAVCTDGLPAGHAPGRWSNGYAEPALNAAFGHFWANNVRGDLQGEYDRVWKAIASYFRDSEWVIGYDPMNEPFDHTLARVLGTDQTDAQLECFYTGTRRPGRNTEGTASLDCPPADPAEGVIPTILSADPNHLVFPEPDIFGFRHPNYVGPMDYPNLVLNFHAYCSHRNGVTGDPTDVDACASQVLDNMLRRAEQRPTEASPSQRGGPAWFMSEFGATTNADLLNRVTSFADELQVGWSYWSWKYYNDPTGSSDEALVAPDGTLQPNAAALARTYPQAIAGTPTTISFDPASSVFHLSYIPDQSVRAPTVVFVPLQMHYPNGYCTIATGAKVTSKPDATHLELTNTPRPSDGDVDVTVSPAPCRREAGSHSSAERGR